MKIITTKFALMNAFLNGIPFELDKNNSMVINQIQRESGSNHTYNIFGHVNKSIYITEFFVITND